MVSKTGSNSKKLKTKTYAQKIARSLIISIYDRRYFQTQLLSIIQWRIYIVKFWTRPPGGPNSFNFMQFLEKFGKIVCWHPPPGSWRPLLGEILDPPLLLLMNFLRGTGRISRYNLGFYQMLNKSLKWSPISPNVFAFYFVLSSYF